MAHGMMKFQQCANFYNRNVEGGGRTESPLCPVEDFTDGPETPSPLPDMEDDDDMVEFSDFDWDRDSSPAKRASQPTIHSERMAELQGKHLRTASLDMKLLPGDGIMVTSSLPAVMITDRNHNEGASASGLNNKRSVYV